MVWVEAKGGNMIKGWKPITEAMAINTTQFDATDLLKAIERQKLDELNERRKANGQELEPIPEELMTAEELQKKKDGEQ